MIDAIEKIFKQLELEDSLWKNLENREDYEEINTQLQTLNQEIKTNLEEHLGKEGRALLFDQEELYYKLLSISQKYFFIEGFKRGTDLKK